jgi:transcriptional antiterminator RfaH
LQGRLRWATLRSTFERTHGVGVEAWYAVLTKPRAEATAQEHLARQGYDCLLPRVKRVLRNAAGLKTRIESLFPNYLFLRADTERVSLAPVRSTRGAIGLVRFGAEPVRVPDGVIDNIKSRIDADDGLVRLTTPDFAPGQGIRVMDGPLVGWEGVFLSEEGIGRVRLLLQLLGTSREVVLPRTQLGLRV